MELKFEMFAVEIELEDKLHLSYMSVIAVKSVPQEKQSTTEYLI